MSTYAHTIEIARPVADVFAFAGLLVGRATKREREANSGRLKALPERSD